ncbi:MAG: hypothetical protein MJA31_21160 [Clostridia bacterium]|nr:hypothetical protein [Clostridia bacterium]
MSVRLVFYGGLHLAEKQKRKEVYVELEKESNLLEVLQKIDFPANSFWLAVAENRVLKLSDNLKGNEKIEFYPPVLGG